MTSKELIEKFGKSTAAKIIAATIIPGGFIIWGAYELNKYINKDKGKDGVQEDT